LLPFGGGGLEQSVSVGFAALFQCGTISVGVSVIRECWIQGDFEVEGVRIYDKVTVPGGNHSSDQLMRSTVTCPSR